MSRDHTFVHSTFLQTATGKGIAGQCILHRWWIQKKEADNDIDTDD